MAKSAFLPPICFLFFFVALNQSAKALPFQKNCASMQAYANAKKWSNPTKFLGFEDKQIHFDGVRLLICGPGYARETSPMGTRVCPANLAYGFPGPYATESFTWSSIPYNKCRWVSSRVQSTDHAKI